MGTSKNWDDIYLVRHMQMHTTSKLKQSTTFASFCIQRIKPNLSLLYTEGSVRPEGINILHASLTQDADGQKLKVTGTKSQGEWHQDETCLCFIKKLKRYTPDQHKQAQMWIMLIPWVMRKMRQRMLDLVQHLDTPQKSAARALVVTNVVIVCLRECCWKVETLFPWRMLQEPGDAASCTVIRLIWLP